MSMTCHAGILRLVILLLNFWYRDHEDFCRVLSVFAEWRSVMKNLFFFFVIGGAFLGVFFLAVLTAGLISRKLIKPPITVSTSIFTRIERLPPVANTGMFRL